MMRVEREEFFADSVDTQLRHLSNFQQQLITRITIQMTRRMRKLLHLRLADTQTDSDNKISPKPCDGTLRISST